MSPTSHKLRHRMVTQRLWCRVTVNQLQIFPQLGFSSQHVFPLWHSHIVRFVSALYPLQGWTGWAENPYGFEVGQFHHHQIELVQCIVHSDSRTALEGCALKRWGLNHQKWNVCKLSCHFLLRSLLEIQLIQLHDRQFIFKQILTLVCHRCLLELWPFISYNWLFLWDYTFYFHGFS